MNYSTGEPHMCIFFFWDILVGILVLPHSARDGCMAPWLTRLAVWLDCCLAGLMACCMAG